LGLFATPTYAYLDPGTGSMLLQGLLAGVAIAIAYFSMYWQKVKSFFLKKKSDKKIDKEG